MEEKITIGGLCLTHLMIFVDFPIGTHITLVVVSLVVGYGLARLIPVNGRATRWASLITFFAVLSLCLAGIVRGSIPLGFYAFLALIGWFVWAFSTYRFRAQQSAGSANHL